MAPLNPPEKIGNWFLGRRLGAGVSGEVWMAVNHFINQQAAIKVQEADSDHPTNKYERSFYPRLQGGVGIPTLFAAGVQGKFDYLVLELLGPSLDSLYRQREPRVVGLRSVITIALQLLSRLEFIHSRGILHRDIQLGNCVIGLEDRQDTLYLIDFGFSKSYIDPTTRKHIPDSRKKRSFIGNYWFSSVNVHCRGKVPSRRDDLEALALMLIHLLTPNGLPWTRKGVPRDKANEERVLREKLEARPEDLCKHLPEVFEDFLRYCRRLKFAALPDYEHWREMFRQLARDEGFVSSTGDVSDKFYWPRHMDVREDYRSKELSQRPDVDVEQLMKTMTEMKLKEETTQPDLPCSKPTIASRPPIAVLSDKTIGMNIGKQIQVDVKRIKSKQETSLVKSDNSLQTLNSSNTRVNTRTDKAETLRLIGQQVPVVKTHKEAAGLILKFIRVLTTGKAKTLTADALAVLVAQGHRLDVKRELSVRTLPREPKMTLSERNEHIRALREKAIKAKATEQCTPIECGEMIWTFVDIVARSERCWLTKDSRTVLEVIGIILARMR